MLEYGEPQVAIAIVFGVLALAIVLVTLAVAAHAKEDVPLADVQRTGYRLRRPWLAFLGGLLVVAVGSPSSCSRTRAGGPPVRP